MLGQAYLMNMQANRSIENKLAKKRSIGMHNVTNRGMTTTNNNKYKYTNEQIDLKVFDKFNELRAEIFYFFDNDNEILKTFDHIHGMLAAHQDNNQTDKEKYRIQISPETVYKKYLNIKNK